MINPVEVRPGNWVLKITGKDKNTRSFFEYKAIGADEYYSTFAQVCFPIEITPSILGKSGFKHEFGDWYINWPSEGIEEGLPYLRFHHEDCSWKLNKISLWSQPVYLHQLQNLFYALSNTELDIQLGRFENTEMMGPIDFYHESSGIKDQINKTVNRTSIPEIM